MSVQVEWLNGQVAWVDSVVKGLGIKSYTQLTPEACRKPVKEASGPWLCDSLIALRSVCVEFLKFQSATDPLQMELIKSQKQIIDLQAELLACKNEQLQSLQSSVKTTVEESVKAEFNTYSSKLQSPAPSIAADTVRSFVKTVVEEEDRSRSLMVFGLPEFKKENLSDKISAVFQDIGEKPRFEASRLGTPSSGDDGKKDRPVKVTMSSSIIVNQILSKSRKLVKSDDHKSVFICPDRSPEQRTRHRELVLKMRSMEAADSTKKYYIKRGEVQIADKS
jgi:hypothetical protein